MLRIIAGKYRHRTIKSPDPKITRPTTDRMREANFGSLHFFIQGKIFLDLFAGSGANPIEAVSRGALKAFAIEKNKDIFKILKENVESLKIHNLETLNMDAWRFLKWKTGAKFDVIYLDPPFKDASVINQIIPYIFENKMLTKYGYILCEVENSFLLELPKGMTIDKEKRYGRKKMLFLTQIL